MSLQPQIDQERRLAIALKRQASLKVGEAFDPVNLKSRPTKGQQQILSDMGRIQFRYVTAGNQSGKTQIGVREVTWLFNETHPTWQRPEKWGTEPLLILVSARTTKQIEENIWRKMQSFLDPSCYQVQKVAGVLQKVIHRENKNTIIFLSHHNENEAREKLQGFVCHYAWLDEMPGSVEIIEEMHRRIQSRSGYFLATFTPKVRSDEIRKLVDASSEPISKKYQLLMFDNPTLTEKDKKAVLDSLASYPDSYKRTVLFGDWSAGERAVYDFDSRRHVQNPEGYDRGWRHTLAVDPAMAGAAGVQLWAEEPSTATWFCVKAKNVEGIQDPESLVKAIEKEAEGYNVVRRISDPHETWYVRSAQKLGYTYLVVWNKKERKHDLIKNSQTFLTEGKGKIAPWCEEFIDELTSCHWSETSIDAIVNHQRLHQIATFQYFVDLRPTNNWTKPVQSFDAALRQADKARMVKDYNKITVVKNALKPGHRWRKQWKLR
jgi:hypothetical protein